MSEEVLEEISLSKSANFQSDKYYEEDIHQDFQNSDIDSKNEDTDESKTVRFNFKGIITLHDEIFSEIDMQEAQKLDLSFNQIQLKQFEQLNGMLEKLITLILKENKVTAIDFSFDCLPNLLNLDLSLNRIERISPQAFKNIKSLKQLNLARNKLTQLNDEVFSGLSSLEVLKLDKNSIESIQQNSFSELANLRMLDLSNNKLTLLDDLIFRSLENITELNLNGNSIANLSSVLFKHLTKISILVLSNNQIETISENVFSKLIYLNQLDLGGNKLTNLSQNAFDGLVNLTMLILSFNKLSNILSETFNGLENLDGLYLSNNDLTKINGTIFKKLKKLQHLDLSSNQIESIEENSFFNLESLANLYLTNNKLSNLNDSVFSNLHSLSILELSKNYLTSIRSPLFSNLNSLQWLGLDFNKIESVEDGVFKNLSKLSSLYMANNNLKSIKKTLFNNLTDLSTLNLATNKISCLDNEAFKSLNNLDILDLNRNQLVSLDPIIFRNLTSVSSIDLGFNKIKTIIPQTFSGLKKCIKINLEANRIETIESKAFWNLESLKSINLANNKIKCLRSAAFFYFDSINCLEEINLTGNGQIEFIDLKTLFHLIKTLDTHNTGVYKKIKIKDIDFFPDGVNKITDEFVNDLVKVAFDMNFSSLFAAGLLLKVAIHLDDRDEMKSNPFKTYLADYYFRSFPELQKFDGFTKIFNYEMGVALPFIHSYLKEFTSDVFYESLLRSESQMFPILTEFLLEFENNILINYLKEKEFGKFEELIKRFLLLCKEPVKSNAYYIILNCLFWENDQNETIFNYVVNNETHSEKYTQNFLLDLLHSLNGLYLKQTKNYYLNLPIELERRLEKADIDIYKSLVILKNSSKCLIHSIARLESNKTFYFLLKDKVQVRLLSEDLSMEMCIQEKTLTKTNSNQKIVFLISNNTLMQILDKYLSLSLEKRSSLMLNVKSIESLAERNDSNLFKKFIDHSFKQNDLTQPLMKLKVDKFKENLRNAFDSCLKIFMKNFNESLAEALIEKIIELEINDYEAPIITYDTLVAMFEIRWWKAIERIFDSFVSSGYSNNDSLNFSEELDEVIVKANETTDKKSNHSFEIKNELEAKEIKDYKSYKLLPQADDSGENYIQNFGFKGFNFLCLDNKGPQNREHVLTIVSKSGQASLIQHKIILRLVELKWRYIPRSVYIFQILMHFIFLVIFLNYILNGFHSSRLIEFNETNDTNSTINSTTEKVIQVNHVTNYVSLTWTLLFLIYFLIYEVFEVIYLKFAYFKSLKNWLEFLTYTMALTVLFSVKIESLIQLTSTLASLSVLFGFIVLVLRLEKDSHFGAYVVAFRKSFIQTVKTLPFIILLFTGFTYSFTIRKNVGVQFISSANEKYLDYLSVAKLLNMVIGSYEVDGLGLNTTSLVNEITNFFIYLTFLILMTIISVNLLTGIAIGELSSVLKEAKIYNKQQRIQYLLLTQEKFLRFENLIKKIIFRNKFDPGNSLIKKIMVFKNDKKSKEKLSILNFLSEWFKKHSQTEIEFIESSEKDTNEYLIEIENKSRVRLDVISNKINEIENKVIRMIENQESFRNDQAKKIDDIDLNVTKQEKQLLEITETLVNKISIIDEKLEKLDQSELLNKQMAEILIKLNELSKK